MIKKVFSIALVVSLSLVVQCDRIDQIVNFPFKESIHPIEVIDTNRIISFSYDGNGNDGGSIPCISANYIIGTKATVASNTGNLVRLGYLFDGWNTMANGSGTNYKAGDTFTVTYQTNKLWAKWVIKDADGNVYTEVKIGTQVWMVENLKTTTYNCGTPIPMVSGQNEWANCATAAYCWLNNNAAYFNTPCGALYNWYVVNPANPKKVAPVGWHISTNADWQILTDYLVRNGYDFEGTQTENRITKSLASKSGWAVMVDPGTPGNDMASNNRSGFSAYPASYRLGGGEFGSIGYEADWWVPSDNTSEETWSLGINCNSQHIGGGVLNKTNGCSIRCVRDY